MNFLLKAFITRKLLITGITNRLQRLFSRREITVILLKSLQSSSFPCCNKLGKELKKAIDFAALISKFGLIKLACLKIFKFDDSPQKIALGLGVGVFLGILPGTGPIAAVVLAAILRINKASVLLGSLLVNTWINVVTFVFAIKIGSVIIGINWRQIYNESLLVFNNFRYANLLKFPIFKLILPTLIGYFIIAVFMGFFAYIAAFLMLNFNKKRCINVK